MITDIVNTLIGRMFTVEQLSTAWGDTVPWILSVWPWTHILNHIGEKVRIKAVLISVYQKGIRKLCL